MSLRGGKIRKKHKAPVITVSLSGKTASPSLSKSTGAGGSGGDALDEIGSSDGGGTEKMVLAGPAEPVLDTAGTDAVTVLLSEGVDRVSGRTAGDTTLEPLEPGDDDKPKSLDSQARMQRRVNALAHHQDVTVSELASETQDLTDPRDSDAEILKLIYAEMALELAFHTSLSIHINPYTKRASKSYPSAHLHPLILPEILDRVFRHLARRRGLHPCLFVCKEWYTQATIVMWEAPSFDSLEKFVTFSRCFINLNDLADHLRHHLLRRAATWRDRGLVSLAQALTSDLHTFSTRIINFFTDDVDPVRSSRKASHGDYQSALRNGETGACTASPQSTKSGLTLEEDGSVGSAWPSSIQWIGNATIATLLTLISGTAGAGKLAKLAKQRFLEDSAKRSRARAYNIRNRLRRMRIILEDWHSSLKKLCKDDNVVDLFRRPYLSRFSCPTGPFIRTLHIHRLSTLTDAILTPCLRACPSLTHLELYACDLLGDESVMTAARSCSFLRILVTPGCSRVSDVSAHAVGRWCKLLETWDVRSCPRISDSGVASVLRGCTKLSHLNLGRTSNADLITSRTLIALSDAPCVTEIACIGLTGCGVGDSGILALLLGSDALRYRVPAPFVVDVSGAAPAAEGGGEKRLAGPCRRSSRDLFGRAPMLKRISLNFCANIGDNAIAAIAEECPQLKVLEIKGCPLIRNIKPLCRMMARGVRIECVPELRKKITEAVDAHKAKPSSQT
ncbi:hypothetical protein HDU67_006473 [Dinochytrium kinnereticum]|nr:hypothetical protein HDU67_006473 [Dinochytrium kinnereticum]